MVHVVRPEVVERHNAGDKWSQSGRNLGVAVVGNMLFPFDLQAVNLGLKCTAYLSGRAREINHHAAGVDHIHSKTMRLEPASNSRQVLFCGAKSRAKFFCCEPVMKVRGLRGVEPIDELLKRLL